MSFIWEQGTPLPVVADADALPIKLTWRYHVHQVARIHQHWRVDSDWWHARVWRDYFRLSTESGLEVVIYHDLLADAWYLLRLYD